MAHYLPTSDEASETRPHELAVSTGRHIARVAAAEFRGLGPQRARQAVRVARRQDCFSIRPLLAAVAQRYRDISELTDATAVAPQISLRA